jgi:outer membrane receptor protein involved in Fe transport
VRTIEVQRSACLATATAVAALIAGAPAHAQQDAGVTGPAQAAGADAVLDANVIVVTAQRRTESLQAVPIAVTALSGESLEARQIDNPADLQLALPSTTFTKTNFTTSSFTIRGIGDLCTGPTCDQATAIHLDGTPLLQTRLFETEFFDLKRLEVLRGPQGTLFGRNATSGVVNFIPARPKLGDFAGAVEAEYGNYDAAQVKGMVNLPIGERLAVRLAGLYQNRDGTTRNLFDGRRFDDRDVYALRGTLRFEPTDTTRIDLLASYTHEDDRRLRIQKQLCQRDPTGVLGCLNGRRDFETVNANATIFSLLTSRELLTALGGAALGPFALGSVYGPDALANAVNPRSVRQVNVDFAPSYRSVEEQYQARIEQELGALNLQVTGFYHRARVDSRQNYTGAVFDRAGYAPALGALAAAAAAPGPTGAYLGPVARALIPNGPAGNLCTSLPDRGGAGVYGGNAMCGPTPLNYDRSFQTSRDWSVEGILTSDFDGRFNFLLGGIYVDENLSDNSYFVNAFPFDYASGVIGTFSALARAPLAGAPFGATPIPPSFLATPFFRNNTDRFTLKSYGIFGEGYVELNDRIKLTVGARYNNDRKAVRARSTLGDFLAPIGTADPFASPFALGYAVAGAPLTSRLTASPFGALDADRATPCVITSPTPSGILTAANVSGCEPFQVRKAKFSEWTGRAVLDFQITRDNLLYASYSRGYKSGGINPPLQVATVPDTFRPELIDAFEIGSKNVFAGGKLSLNLTGFFYKYKDLQLSRIVERTSVNDNVNAEIYGVEAEALVRPSRDFVVNLSASYLHTRVSEDKFLTNPRDPGGGRADAVIVKDLLRGNNCAVVPNVAGAAAVANGFVANINGAINAGLVPGVMPGAGLRAPGRQQHRLDRSLQPVFGAAGSERRRAGNRPQ